MFKDPINLFTFGYGTDHNSELLSSLASKCGGSYYFMQTTDSIPEAFADCLGGLMSVVAQNISVTLTAADGVSINSLLTNFKTSEISPNKQFQVSLGDIYSEERRDLVLDLKLAPTPGPTSDQPLVVVHLECHNVLTGETEHQELVCSLTRTGLDEPNGDVSVRVDEQRNRVRTAQALDQARLLSDAGNLAAARQHLEENLMAMRGSAAAGLASTDAFCRDIETTVNCLSSTQEVRMIASARAHFEFEFGFD